MKTALEARFDCAMKQCGLTALALIDWMVFAHGVETFENSVFDPCKVGRTGAPLQVSGLRGGSSEPYQNRGAQALLIALAVAEVESARCGPR